MGLHRSMLTANWGRHGIVGKVPPDHKTRSWTRLSHLSLRLRTENALVIEYRDEYGVDLDTDCEAKDISLDWLLRKTPRDILGIYNLGRKRLTEIREVLGARGLYLKDDQPENPK